MVEAAQEGCFRGADDDATRGLTATQHHLAIHQGHFLEARGECYYWLLLMMMMMMTMMMVMCLEYVGKMAQ